MSTTSSSFASWKMVDAPSIRSVSISHVQQRRAIFSDDLPLNFLLCRDKAGDVFQQKWRRAGTVNFPQQIEPEHNYCVGHYEGRLQFPQVSLCLGSLAGASLLQAGQGHAFAGTPIRVIQIRDSCQPALKRQAI